MTDYNYDQTQFAQEEPLFEKTAEVVLPPAPAPTPTPSDVPPKKSKMLLFVAGGLIFFIFIIGVILLAVFTRSKTPASDIDEQETEEEQQMLGPFMQRLNELESQLQAADPSKEELPFPPIDMEIRLEE
jgi:hypothetical protein